MPACGGIAVAEVYMLDNLALQRQIIQHISAAFLTSKIKKRSFNPFFIPSSRHIYIQAFFDLLDSYMEALHGRNDSVISVTRLNGSKLYINAEMIRTVEETPDTIITLVNDQKMVVRDPITVIVERVIEYRRQVNTPWTGPVGRNDGQP
jgi:flagellar protein FlbD